MRKLRRLSLLVWLPVILVIGYQDSARAVNGTLKQQILPLDCVYQIVNDGTGTIVYLTPSECGVLPQPTVNMPSIPATPTTGGEQVITIVDSGSAIFEIPFVPVSSNPTNTTPSNAVVAGVQFLPHESLTDVDDNKTQTSRAAESSTISVYVPVPIAIMGISALILLLLLVFL